MRLQVTYLIKIFKILYYFYLQFVAVAHGSYFFIKTKILNKYINENDFFILLLSSLCHDVDHTGRNNGFEAASLSKLAIRYHDESVISKIILFKNICN